MSLDQIEQITAQVAAAAAAAAAQPPVRIKGLDGTSKYVQPLDEIENLEPHMAPPAKSRYHQFVGAMERTYEALAGVSIEQYRPVEVVSLRSEQDADAWLQGALEKHDYVVLLMFRGSWCPMCKKYLESASLRRAECDARSIGVYCVCSQDSGKFFDAMASTWRVAYPMVSDTKNHMARRFGLAATQASTNVRLLRAISKVVKQYKLNKPGDEYSDDCASLYPGDMLQPNILVFDRRAGAGAGGDASGAAPFYRWSLPPMRRNGYGMYQRVLLDHVLTIIEFYNDAQNRQLSNALSRHDHARGRVFELVLTDPELRDLLMRQMSLEFNSEPLEFLDECEKLLREGQLADEAIAAALDGSI